MRKLLPFPDHFQEWMLYEAELELDKYPGAKERPDSDMGYFHIILEDLDHNVQESLAALVSHAGIIPFNQAAGLDRLDLCQKLLVRWDNPSVQAALRIMEDHANKRDLQRVRAHPDRCREMVPEVALIRVIWYLEVTGNADRIAPLMESVPELYITEYKWRLARARTLFHRYVLYPDAEESRRRELQRCKRLLHHLKDRQVRFRSLQIDLLKLRHLRKGARSQAVQAERAADAHLTLADMQLAALQAAEAQAEAEHQQALSELARAKEAKLAALRAELAATLREYAAVVAERSAWGTTQPLADRTVVVIGDDPHAEGYRTLVESAGGRLIHVSAVEKFGRIGPAATGADLVIFSTAHATHKAEHLLRKAWKNPQGVLLRCPVAGLSTFGRLLRQEALPRLVTGARRSTAVLKGG